MTAIDLSILSVSPTSICAAGTYRPRELASPGHTGTVETHSVARCERTQLATRCHWCRCRHVPWHGARPVFLFSDDSGTDRGGLPGRDYGRLHWRCQSRRISDRCRGIDLRHKSLTSRSFTDQRDRRSRRRIGCLGTPLGSALARRLACHRRNFGRMYHGAWPGNHSPGCTARTPCARHELYFHRCRRRHSVRRNSSTRLPQNQHHGSLDRGCGGRCRRRRHCNCVLAWHPPCGSPTTHQDLSQPPRARAAWYAVIAASFLFSFGLVPHTIYWFDYLARDLGLGYTIAGWHWTGVGIFAILGPVAAAWLAQRAGTAIAIIITYFVLAAGLGIPWLAQTTAVLVASTIIFGAQPGASTLLGARARDLGSAGDMPAMMRTTILANGMGSALAGIMIPKLLDITGSYELLFLTGGLAMLIGGLLCLATSVTR